MTDKLTLAAFAEFCESKPADEKYEYIDVGNCACAQFAKSIGFSSQADLPQPLWEDAEEQACQRPRTFGALAKRLREAV
jgi:hypothetical protein